MRNMGLKQEMQTNVDLHFSILANNLLLTTFW